MQPVFESIVRVLTAGIAGLKRAVLAATLSGEI